MVMSKFNEIICGISNRTWEVQIVQKMFDFTLYMMEHQLVFVLCFKKTRIQHCELSKDLDFLAALVNRETHCIAMLM
jgi:hypothetical protein